MTYAPTHIATRLALSLALIRSGQEADAIKVLQETIELAPGSADANAYLGALLVDGRDLGAGVAALRLPLVLDPGNVVANRAMRRLGR